MRRALIAVAAAAMLLIAGCGRDMPFGPSGADFEPRAQKVLDAWDKAALADAWHSGFVPVADLERPDAGPNEPIYADSPDPKLPENAKLAMLGGFYRLVAKRMLPAGPSTGQIRFPDGSMMTVPMATAGQAFDALNRRQGSSTDCPESCALSVTGASIGTMTVATSRGMATVPAWKFTVEQLRVPMLRIAVAASAISQLPTPQMEPDMTLTAVEAVDAADGSHDPSTAKQIRLHFTGGACDKTRLGLVHERADAIVVGVDIAQKPGACIAIGVIAQVDVTLNTPVGDRVILDANSGRPVVFGACRPFAGVNGC
jgi:hypothetical protein